MVHFVMNNNSCFQNYVNTDDHTRQITDNPGFKPFTKFPFCNLFSFQLDNHGNHMLLTDESPINVPGIAAAHVIKRYTAQAADEISLEVLRLPSSQRLLRFQNSEGRRGRGGGEPLFKRNEDM